MTANAASGTEKKIRMTVPISPPIVEATKDTPNPIPGFPWHVSGYPSNAVTTADAVPGALIVTAVIDPP